MPRFFFNVTTDDRLDRDLEGTELPDAATARVEATQCFGEMIRCAAVSVPERWSMEVHDDMGKAVATASFRMTAAK